MRRIKAVIYGVGTIGKLTTKYMVAKGIDIVGAIDVAPEIVGKDLGEVATLGRLLNVRINDNADAVLSQQEADIVVVSIYSQMDRMFPIFHKCIENGLNVITPAEEALYPWGISPELAAKLDKLAKKHGVTITASGGQDTFRVNIPAILTGASHTIESMTLREKGDLSESGPASARNYHLGHNKDQFYREIREKGLSLSSLRICLEAIIADLGLTINKVEQHVEPTIDDVDVKAKGVVGGIVKKGLVTGMAKTIDIETEQGIKFYGEQTYKAFNEDEKAQGRLQECLIKGVPDLHLRLHIMEIEPKSSAVSQMVNRVPDVINSEPGYITVERLGKLKFRAFPPECYVIRGREK